MRDLRIGLIGAGMVSRHHVLAWDACPAASLVAIADPDMRAAQERARPGMSVYPSLTALLAGETVDAIDIASPVQTHAALVHEAAQAGAPTLCQKPLAPSAEEARALIAALPPGARVMLHENWRWREPYRSLKRSLESREPPKTFHMRVVSSGLIPDASGRRPALVRQPFLAELERLLVFELLGHHLDVLSYLFGVLEVESAEIRRQTQAVRGEDFASISLRAGPCRGVLTGDFACAKAPPLPADRLSIDGAPVVDGWRHLAQRGATASNADDVYQRSYDQCIADFADCIRSGRAFETPVEHGVYLLEIVEEIYRRARWEEGV